VKLSLPPENPPRQATSIGGRNPLTGARVENLSPAVATDLQMDLMAKGVVVLSVSDGSIADNQGFRPGDIIKSVNGTGIGNVGQLQSVLTNAQNWDMVVDRAGRNIHVQIGG
jgi:serine protease Do